MVVDISYITPQDVRQFLFKLTPKQPGSQAVTALGKLDIVWRLSMGSMGRLQTSHLVRKSQTVEMFDFALSQLPRRVFVEERFTASFTLKNQFKYPIDASVTVIKERMGTTLVCGPSTVDLGILQPDETLAFTLDFFPLIPGFCLIDGLRVSDKQTGAFSDCPPIDVFVFRRHSTLVGELPGTAEMPRQQPELLQPPEDLLA